MDLRPTKEPNRYKKEGREYCQNPSRFQCQELPSKKPCISRLDVNNKDKRSYKQGKYKALNLSFGLKEKN